MRYLWIAALLAATYCAAQDWEPQNLVQNPGFEVVDAGGRPAGWDGALPVYTVVGTPTHSGSKALQFVNADAGKYVMCSQKLPLDPGWSYEMSGWIKTEGIEGEDNGATICLEWYDAEGNYLGGSYPAGFKGDTDWRQLKAGSQRVHDDAASCSVICYVRKGMTGKAWWDDITVTRRRLPPMSTLLMKPNYRGQVTPDIEELLFKADLNVHDYGLEPGDTRLKADLVAADGGATAASRELVPEGDSVTMALPTAGLEPGRYTLNITLNVPAAGKDLASDSWRVRVLTDEEAKARTTYIDKHNRLIRDGKPFFPLGMYWSGITEANLDIYADSAFNCLMPYGAPDMKKLDLVQKYGLKVFFSVKDAYYGSSYCPPGIETVDDERAFLQERAEQYGNHPALLAWYLNDELPLAYMDRLQAHQEWMEELDPNHPTWVVLYQVGLLEHYARTFDVIGTDPYPIPDRPASLAAAWTRRSVDALAGSRPAWMVPQVFNWGVYKKTEEEKKGLRPPTLEEIRSMTWQCIAEGATGLIYYSFFDIQRDKVVPFSTQWDEVKRVAAEVDDMIPAILSVEPSPAINTEAADWLNWTTRTLDGVTYLIAVNNGSEVQSTRFDFNGETAEVSLRGEEGPLTDTAAGTLEVHFEPFGVRVYELRF